MRGIDLAGQRFGRLSVVAFHGHELLNGKPGQLMWLVRCDCDPEGQRAFAAASSNLRRGKTQSCGCLRAEQLAARSITHGLTRDSQTGRSGRALHPLYTTWGQIRARTRDPNNPIFAKYGARGIGMCERWYSDFGAFAADMGSKPAKSHSVDRIDNARGYECGDSRCPDCGPKGLRSNCRWASRTAQGRNKTNNHMLTLDGVTATLAEWAERTGIPYPTIRTRASYGRSP